MSPEAESQPGFWKNQAEILIETASRLGRPVAMACLAVTSVGSSLVIADSLVEQYGPRPAVAVAGLSAETAWDGLMTLEDSLRALRSLAPPATPEPTPVEAAAQAAPAPDESLRAAAVETPLIHPEVEARINAMNLTPEGFEKAMANISYEWFDYAQGKVEFNPDLVAIEQGFSERFNWHFTVLTYDGNVQSFIDLLADRSGGVCCGVNWFIDFNGRIYQLAPLDAKLRHNGPDDSVRTGVEMESPAQEAITTAMYEAAAYLTILVLRQQGLLDPLTLDTRARGHGEERDELRAADPNSKWKERDDFDAPVSAMLRKKIKDFLLKYPDAASSLPTLR